jgi:tetratricopeptide (TPR) repeat protein
MWGRKKDSGPALAEIPDLDGQIRRLRAVVATDARPTTVGMLISLLTVRATLAAQVDRHEQVLEDRRAAAGLLRGFDGQDLPVERRAALLTWMGLAATEERAGQLDVALEAAERGVALATDLAPDEADVCAAFLHDLESLRLAAKEAGLTAEVVRAAVLSSDLATRLAEHDEDAYVAVLGLTLVNEAAARANAGDLESAAAVNEEAIRILQDRSDQSAGLTVALTNRAAWARRDGRWEEAVVTEQRLLDGVRAQRADLATEADRLNALFLTLLRAGRREEAEQTISEAVAVTRRLADTDVEQMSVLATLLGNQANIRGELHRYEDALTSSEEALALRELLAATHPSRESDQGLAMILNNHAVVLRRLDRLPEAAASAARSVELRRRLAADGGAGSVALLANSLNSHAEQLGHLGDGAGAVTLAEEARDLYAGLPAPGAVKKFLRANQETLGRALAIAGRHVEAVAAAERAVEIGREAAAEAPGEIPELASCLDSLADRLGDVGRAAEAHAARSEAVQLRSAAAS